MTTEIEQQKHAAKPTSQDYSLHKKLLSRRFALALLAMILASIMLYAGLIKESSYETILVWVTGIYIIGKPFGDKVGEFLLTK